jgi:hypothetical protein
LSHEVSIDVQPAMPGTPRPTVKSGVPVAVGHQDPVCPFGRDVHIGGDRVSSVEDIHCRIGRNGLGLRVVHIALAGWSYARSQLKKSVDCSTWAIENLSLVGSDRVMVIGERTCRAAHSSARRRNAGDHGRSDGFCVPEGSISLSVR